MVVIFYKPNYRKIEKMNQNPDLNTPKLCIAEHYFILYDFWFLISQILQVIELNNI